MPLTLEDIERLATESGKLLEGTFDLLGFGQGKRTLKRRPEPKPTQRAGPGFLTERGTSQFPIPSVSVQPQRTPQIDDIVRIDFSQPERGNIPFTAPRGGSSAQSLQILKKFDRGTGLFQVAGPSDPFLRNPDGSLRLGISVSSKGKLRRVPVEEPITDLKSFTKVTGLIPFGSQFDTPEGERFLRRRQARQRNPGVRQDAPTSEGLTPDERAGVAIPLGRGKGRRKRSTRITLAGLVNPELRETLG